MSRTHAHVCPAYRLLPDGTSGWTVHIFDARGAWCGGRMGPYTKAEAQRLARAYMRRQRREESER